MTLRGGEFESRQERWEFFSPGLTFYADSYSFSVPSRATAVARKRPRSFWGGGLHLNMHTLLTKVWQRKAPAAIDSTGFPPILVCGDKSTITKIYFHLSVCLSPPSPQLFFGWVCIFCPSFFPLVFSSFIFYPFFLKCRISSVPL